METKRWKFCPECGGKLEEPWKHCAACGLEIGAVLVITVTPQPQPIIYPIYQPPTIPYWPNWPVIIGAGDPNPLRLTTTCGTQVM